MSKRSRRVLIVEDDLGIVEFIQFILEDEGFETKSAVGEMALRLAEDYLPDLILLDIMMPLMDGLEWSQRAKAHPILKNIPIITISAANQDALKSIYKDLQTDSFIKKPFDIDCLLNLVNAFTYHLDTSDTSGA